MPNRDEKRFSPFPTWMRVANAGFFETRPATRQLRAAIGEELGESGGSLLEIGCGFGFNADFCRGDYLGVDPDERVIVRARKRRPQKRFQVMDGARLDLQGASVEEVLLCLVIHELDPECREQTLAEAARVARGRILIFDFRNDLDGLRGWWIRLNEGADFGQYLGFDLETFMRGLGRKTLASRPINRFFRCLVFQ